MMRRTASIRDTFTNITYPVAKQAIFNIINTLDIDDYFKGKVFINSDSTAASSGTDEQHNAKLNDNRLVADIKHVLDPREVKWPAYSFAHAMNDGGSSVTLQNTKPLFFDIVTQTSVFERTLPFNIVLDVTMSLQDRVAVEEIMDKLVSNYVTGAMVYLQDITFSYPLSPEIYGILFGAHKLMGNDITSYVSYLSSRSGERIGLQVNRNSPTADKELIVQNNISNVLMEIDYNVAKADKEGEGKSTDLYTINFSVTLQFGRPTMLTVQYPIVMNNQMIPQDMVYGVNQENLRKHETVHPYFTHNKLCEWSKGATSDHNVPAVRIPWYDNWRAKSTCALVQLKYREFYSIVFTIDDVDNAQGVTTIDLVNDLPYPIVPEVMDVITEQGAKSLFMTETFAVSVFVNDVIAEPTTLSLENNILTIPNRELLPVYRLVFSEYIGKPYGTLNPFRVLIADIIAERAAFDPRNY